jgi:hypothetical protein
MKRSGDRLIGRSGDRKKNRVTNYWNAICFVLREIFDEAAYDRFLQKTNRLRSVESYRDFVHERDTSMPKRNRCC